VRRPNQTWQSWARGNFRDLGSAGERDEMHRPGGLLR
jgi:hypothetical protein